MPVELFIEERSGNIPFSVVLEDRETARKVIGWILHSGGYWADSDIEASGGMPFSWSNPDRSIYIPLHRIDYFKVLDYFKKKEPF